MADALAKYRAALKRYRKENPKVPYATAQKRVSAEMKSGKVSGVKKRKKVGAGAPQKRAIGATRKRVKAKAVKVSGTRRIAAAPRKISGISKATKLLNSIEKLEIRRREAKAREMKDVIQLEINKLHDQLDSLRGVRKRRSA